MESMATLFKCHTCFVSLVDHSAQLKIIKHRGVVLLLRIFLIEAKLCHGVRRGRVFHATCRSFLLLFLFLLVDRCRIETICLFQVLQTLALTLYGLEGRIVEDLAR